jgi:hypothetical protein
MKTPKEKAKEILFKMYKVENGKNQKPNCFYIAKNSSLIAVNEILEVNQEDLYWKDVKKELEKI